MKKRKKKQQGQNNFDGRVRHKILHKMKCVPNYDKNKTYCLVHTFIRLFNICGRGKEYFIRSTFCGYYYL